MEKFDVVIVGGGPAGLICAERLSKTDLSVILLEKDNIFGDKVCAGGLTRKDLMVIDPPKDIFAHIVHDTALHSPSRHSHAHTPVDPIVVTVDRKDLGRWQRSLLDGTSVQVRTNSKVIEVKNDQIVLKGGEKIAYTHLVGADGYASVVRRFLGFPQEKKMQAIQYMVPMEDLEPKLEIFLDSKYFSSWYGWIFPHDKKICVGCGCDPRYHSPQKMKKRFHQWLEKKGIDISNAEYQSSPISFDFRGLRFNNIYLVGDAAGIGSGLTGEGIYQSLVTGVEVAEYICGRTDESDEFKYVQRYNRIQEKIMMFLIRIGPLRKIVFELIIILMNNKRFKNRINNGFS